MRIEPHATDRGQRFTQGRSNIHIQLNDGMVKGCTALHLALHQFHIELGKRGFFVTHNERADPLLDVSRVALRLASDELQQTR